MKIAIVSLWAQKLFDASEPAQFGGAELQLHLLAHYFVRQCGAEVRFITRGEGPFKIFTTDAGIEVWKLPYRKTYSARAALGLWDLYKACLDVDADVYIQRSGGIETGVTAFAAKQKGRPFVFMCSHIWDVNRVHERDRGRFYGAVYLFGLRNAKSIITQTSDQHDLLLENYGRESLMLRSAHVIPEQSVAPTSGVLWISRCDVWKHPHYLLNLAEALPQHSFTMVCPLLHPNSNRLELFKEIEQRARSISNVTFYPGVSFGETEQLFESHRIFVNTSENEGYPNTYVQAFKWGRPVAALHVDPDGILNHQGLGGCANGDKEQFIKMTQALLQDDRKWREQSDNARRFAIEQHDINRIGTTLYQHLEEWAK